MRLSDASAVAVNRVRATFSAAPLMRSPLQDGDILNPRSCSIGSPGRAAYSVLAIELVSTTVFEFVLLEPMEDYRIAHTLSAVALLASDRTPIEPGYSSATFAGLQDPSRQPAARVDRIRDLSNPPSAGTKIPGTLQISDAGDYVHDAGAALVRKLVVRRVITRLRGFFHLPKYGLGFEIKKPGNIGEISKRKAEIMRQVLCEPEVQSVDVMLSFGVGDEIGVTTLFLKIKLRSGGSLEFSV